VGKGKIPSWASSSHPGKSKKKKGKRRREKGEGEKKYIIICKLLRILCNLIKSTIQSVGFTNNNNRQPENQKLGEPLDVVGRRQMASQIFVVFTPILSFSYK